MSDDLMPYETLTTQAIALVFADYVHAVSERGDDREESAWDAGAPIEDVVLASFEFQIPREVLIAELERMYGWLEENHKAMNGNGHRG